MAIGSLHLLLLAGVDPAMAQRRCVQRGLIPEAEAVALAVELSLIEANPAAAQPSAVPTRP